MFRIDSCLPSDAEIDLIVGLMRDAAEAPAEDNPKIPAGYTYLGQFIDHDITYDPASVQQKVDDPGALIDYRTPRLDLDSLYGRGPKDDPFLYDISLALSRDVELLVGKNPPGDDDFEPRDLPRNHQGRALLGDPRNDENIIVSQLHLVFIRFHNWVVGHVQATRPDLKDGGPLLAECQRIVRWHYQWIVVHDFLERIAGKELAQAVLAKADHPHFKWKNNPYMPIEFSAAAYRFGHSMVRPHYDLNAANLQKPIFSADDDPGPMDDLRGFRRLPSGWTIDWRRFFKISDAEPQHSRRIDTKLSPQLFRLAKDTDRDRRALPWLNLHRGRSVGLPSGQAVAAALGQQPLTAEELGLEGPLGGQTPLWYYLLREAEVRAGGEHLGPVGGLIVAEVLVGLLDGDPQSYLRMNRGWKPELPSATEDDFTMEDLVKLGLP
jgi:hypothetical protein